MTSSRFSNLKTGKKWPFLCQRNISRLQLQNGWTWKAQIWTQHGCIHRNFVRNNFGDAWSRDCNYGDKISAENGQI